jgi:hypothetical protein
MLGAACSLPQMLKCPLLALLRSEMSWKQNYDKGYNYQKDRGYNSHGSAYDPTEEERKKAWTRYYGARDKADRLVEQNRELEERLRVIEESKQKELQDKAMAKLVQDQVAQTIGAMTSAGETKKPKHDDGEKITKDFTAKLLRKLGRHASTESESEPPELNKKTKTSEIGACSSSSSSGQKPIMLLRAFRKLWQGDKKSKKRKRDDDDSKHSLKTKDKAKKKKRKSSSSSTPSESQSTTSRSSSTYAKKKNKTKGQCERRRQTRTRTIRSRTPRRQTTARHDTR